jgi:hypothetical protein
MFGFLFGCFVGAVVGACGLEWNHNRLEKNRRRALAEAGPLLKWEQSLTSEVQLGFLTNNGMRVAIITPHKDHFCLELERPFFYEVVNRHFSTLEEAQRYTEAEVKEMIRL